MRRATTRTPESLVAVCVCFVLAASWSPAAEYDSGPIASIVDDTVYVEGNNGTYELQLLGLCTWCEEGLEVLIRFDSVAKASMKPQKGPDDFSIFKAVRALIIRDARYER
jgi:hypothetical protein